MIAAGVRTGLRQRMDPRRRHEAHLRRLDLRAHGAHVAALRRQPNDYGILVMDEEELYACGRKAHEADWQIGMHANGDVAIDMVLTALRAAAARSGRDADPRHRIEHCTLVNADLIRRIKALRRDPDAVLDLRLLPRREDGRSTATSGSTRMFAHESFLDAGIRVPQASDYPPGPFEPMMALQSMVTRTDIQGTRLGRQAEDHGRRGAARSARSTAPTPRSRRT